MGRVLILVLMEDTLRGSHRSLRYHYQTVLILVLMEDTLRALVRAASGERYPS